MATPVVKHKGSGGFSSSLKTNGRFVTLVSGDLCGQCGDKGHIMSDHVVEKATQCNKCTCVAQDTEQG